MGEMKVENWCGYEIRFVEQDGEWWAILKDICDALGLRTAKVAERLDPEMMLRVKVDVSNVPSRDLRSRGDNKTRWMMAINEIGVYEALFASKRLEARKLRRWVATMLQRLRKHAGLEGYQVMKMTEQVVQDKIDHYFDDIFYDEEKGMLMRSITVRGGEVEVIPFNK